MYKLFFETQAVFDPGVLSVVWYDFVAVLLIKPDCFRLFLARFQDAPFIGQFRCPILQLSQDFAGDAFASALERCVHPFDFHHVRRILFDGATGYGFLIFIGNDHMLNFVYLIELSIKRMVFPVPFRQIRVQVFDQLNKIRVI